MKTVTLVWKQPIVLKQDNRLHWLIKVMFASCPSRYFQQNQGAIKQYWNTNKSINLFFLFSSDVLWIWSRDILASFFFRHQCLGFQWSLYSDIQCQTLWDNRCNTWKRVLKYIFDYFVVFCPCTARKIPHHILLGLCRLFTIQQFVKVLSVIDSIMPIIRGAECWLATQDQLIHCFEVYFCFSRWKHPDSQKLYALKMKDINWCKTILGVPA